MTLPSRLDKARLVAFELKHTRFLARQLFWT